MYVYLGSKMKDRYHITDSQKLVFLHTVQQQVFQHLGIWYFRIKETQTLFLLICEVSKYPEIYEYNGQKLNKNKMKLLYWKFNLLLSPWL